MRKFTVITAAFVLVLGAAGYTLAQMGGAQGGMMGPGMMGQGGHGPMTGGAMMNMMSGQPLTQEQLEQFAARHGITVEQAKQMTDTCAQIMSNAKANPPQAK
jgi:Spy/CpxP family protein refolding chaperone